VSQVPAPADLSRLLGGHTRRVPNLGLVWRRYLPTLSPPGRKGVSSAACDHFVEVCRSSGPRLRLLQELLDRRRLVLANTPGLRNCCYTTRSRLCAGAGDTSVIENASVTLHHTYGFPVLPAASLKGLLRHYLIEELSGLEADMPAAELDGIDAAALAVIESLWKPGCTVTTLVQGLLGSPESGEGLLLIHDGWPTKVVDDGWLEQDLLASHHKRYYAGDSDYPSANDCEGPNLVPVLVVRPGTCFEVLLGLSGPGARALPDDQARNLLVGQAGTWLTMALDHWGAGARTGAGYGRLRTPTGDECREEDR
jgi:CRISPR-associated protein Cmr6